jgi:hypothetical protein
MSRPGHGLPTGRTGAASGGCPRRRVQGGQCDHLHPRPRGSGHEVCERSTPCLHPHVATAHGQRGAFCLSVNKRSILSNVPITPTWADGPVWTYRALSITVRHRRVVVVLGEALCACEGGKAGVVQRVHTEEGHWFDPSIAHQVTSSRAGWRGWTILSLRAAARLGVFTWPQRGSHPGTSLGVTQEGWLI